MEEKLRLGVSGYLKLYDLTNHNYHDLNNKQKTGGEDSAQVVF